MTTADQSWQALADWQPRRTITAFHLHHTWRPRHADFRGLATINESAELVGQHQWLSACNSGGTFCACNSSRLTPWAAAQFTQ